MDFNINEYVHVKLTKLGKTIWINHIEKYHGMRGIEKTGKLPDWVKHNDMGKGWWRFQMWELMNIFGPHIHMGSKNPFELKIKIPE